VRAILGPLGLSESAVGGSLDQSLSHGRDGTANAPQARYFVIHDTSTWLDVSEFPPDINTSGEVNNLASYGGGNAVAHMFINRRGEMLVGHQLSVPWRATKLEKNVGIPSKGMFIHVESIQRSRHLPRCQPHPHPWRTSSITGEAPSSAPVALAGGTGAAWGRDGRESYQAANVARIVRISASKGGRGRQYAQRRLTLNAFGTLQRPCRRPQAALCREAGAGLR
jgi:hypothetical protein